MDWTIPRFTRPEVDRAGKVLRSFDGPDTEIVAAFEVLDNWRASHAFPLNTFQVTLRSRAREFDKNALVAQRLKRVPSIMRKLDDRPTMRLSQMQDIGGCRAVVRGMRQLSSLRRVYAERSLSGILHTTKDYIDQPAASGYRSLHLVYRYRSGRSTDRAVFDGQLVEVQIRTQVQHAWATAVETVGTIIGKALKSNEGPSEWLDLMRHVSSLFAQYEGTPTVAGSLPRTALIKHVRAEARRLRIAERLTNFRNALQLLEGSRSKKDRYFLLRLDPEAESLQIKSYRAGQFDEASEEYLAIERSIPKGSSIDVVLVRADSIDALRRAYPNYFLDTQLFLQLFGELTARKPQLSAG